MANGNDEDEPPTVVASPSFEEMLRQQESGLGGPTPPDGAPRGQAPAWNEDIAFAATQMSPSFDERAAAQGQPVGPSEPPAPPSQPAHQFPPPAQPPGAFPPPPGTPPPAAQPSHAGFPPPPAQAPPGPAPLPKTMALDMSNNPFASAPGLNPQAQPPGPPAGPAPHLGTPAPYGQPYAPPMGQPAPPPQMTPQASGGGGQNKLLLFIVTFGAVFVIGSLCFGGAALFLLR